MIRVTRLNGTEVHLNADLISTVESHHDTVVTLVDGRCFVVTEPAADVVSAIIDYRARVLVMTERMLTADRESADREAAGRESTGRETARDGGDLERAAQSARLLVLRPTAKNGE